MHGRITVRKGYSSTLNVVLIVIIFQKKRVNLGRDVTYANVLLCACPGKPH